MPDVNQTEKVTLLSGIQFDKKCSICLEVVSSETNPQSGYYTEKCRNFFNKKCL